MSKLDIGCCSMTVNLLKWKSENGNREVVLRHNGEAEGGGMHYFTLLTRAENGSTLENYGSYDVARRDFKRAVSKLQIPDPIVAIRQLEDECQVIGGYSVPYLKEAGFKMGDRVRVTVERVEE